MGTEEEKLITIADEYFERYSQAIETLRPTFEALCELIEALWMTLAEQLRLTFDALWKWYVGIKRETLYLSLRQRHIPHWLARFLAQNCPERWLPEPRLEQDRQTEAEGEGDR